MTFRGHHLRVTVFCLFVGIVGTAMAVGQVSKRAFLLPAEVPAPANNKVTPERTELGKMLFFDPRLSGSARISCASCHNPTLGWSDALPTAVGDERQVLSRATPSIVNAAYNDVLMWDGRFRTLEEQSLGPIRAPSEMHGSMEEIIAKLKRSPGYTEEFDRAYPGEGVTSETIAKAIASFERTVITRDSPFDQWIAGNKSAIGDSAERGFALFIGKANCVACHQPPNFTDQGFHNIGVRGNQDDGRFAKVPIRVLKGAFKTPSLRDVTLTAPYMHNGAYQTLPEVIDHYNRGGDEKANLDPNIKPLGLTVQEKKDLATFLESLTGKASVVVNLPKLPQ